MEHVTQISLPAPAKINRFLHIVGRRNDGYHLLQTLFQFLDHGDTLHFQLRQDDQILLEPKDMQGIPDDINLIKKAAIALQNKMPHKQGITITVDKILPLGSGLGGGSSNAATTLWGLNWIWQLGLSCQELLEIAVTLGADVPVFVYGHTALGEGIGEKLSAIELNESWIVVVIPDCQVSTPKMYADPELTRNSQALRIGALAKDEIENALDGLRNDFEPVVRRHYPAVDAAMKWLSDFGKVRLSGSGASVFISIPTQAQANAVLQNLPSQFKGFIAKGTNISPLVIAAEKSGFKCPDWGVAKR